MVLLFKNMEVVLKVTLAPSDSKSERICSTLRPVGTESNPCSTSIYTKNKNKKIIKATNSLNTCI